VKKQHRLVLVGLVVVFAAASALVLSAGEPSRIAHIEGSSSTPVASEGRALTTLQWDDGSFESGLGSGSGGGYIGQLATRFGGASATTMLNPMQLRGAYWRFFSGNPGVTAVNINFWHPLAPAAPQFPTGTAPVWQLPGNANTTATQFVSGMGPTIATPNMSVIVGVGVLGNSAWFLAHDTSGGGRQYFGYGTTQHFAYGAATLSGYGYSFHNIIRLYVDGNVPVELQMLTVE